MARTTTARVRISFEPCPAASLEALAEELENRWCSGRNVRALAGYLFELDPVAWAHGIRVMQEASAIGSSLGFGRSSLETLEIAALLHDVGKLALAPEVVDKAGPLSREERRLVREHPTIGARLLGRVGGLEEASVAVLYHHERFDGTGYPTGLRGEVIPLPARVIAVADSLDAMLSDRPYRRRLSLHQAAAELRENAGGQFDPTVVDLCLERWAPPRPKLGPNGRKPLHRRPETRGPAATGPLRLPENFAV